MNVFSENNHITIHIQEYLQHLTFLKYGHRSIESYKNALNRFYSFLTAKNIKRLQDVTRSDLDSYRLVLVDKAYTGQSIVLYMRAVRNLFAFLEENRQIFINPAQGLIIPAAEKIMQPVPTEQEVETLLAQPQVTTLTGIRDRAIIETFYSTGVRLEELVGMRTTDLNQKEGTVKVIGKGNKERMVPLGKKANRWLSNYLKQVRPAFCKNKPDQMALWLGTLGKRINPQIVERMVTEYTKEAGIKCRITPHALRRACGTHMLANGAHPVQIQLLLGHSTLSTLSKYLKITITDMMKMHKRGRPGK